MSDTMPAAPTALELRLSDDKVRVLLDCPDPHRDLQDTVEDILAALEKLELPEMPAPEFLTELLTDRCPPGEPAVGLVLIQAQDPVPPRDGRLDWSRDFFVTGWEVGADGETVDFWAKLDNRAVVADELLLTLYPETAGSPGLNVYGNKIPVDKPARVRMRAGKGVIETATDDGVRSFTADYAGRMRFNDNTLLVDAVYVIKGDVDLETGNITHTGTLQIEGDVKAGASIAADGDIVIKGMLEPAMVRAGGGLTVHGGIVGSPETTITVGGDLQAKYMNEARLRVEGDVSVTGEINHCDLETRGRVEVPRGRIAGGRTVARRGIIVGEAGAGGASQTLLVAGVDPQLATRLRDKKERQHRLEQARVQLRQAVDNLGQDPDANEEAAATLLATLEAKARRIGQALADGEMEIRRTTREAMAEAREAIFMLRGCWSGTTVQLGDVKCLVRASIMKPRLVKRFGRRVRVVPMGEHNGPPAA